MVARLATEKNPDKAGRGRRTLKVAHAPKKDATIGGLSKIVEE